MNKLVTITLLVIIMLTVSMPVLAMGPQNHQAITGKQAPLDVAPYDRITGYDFHPTQDYNQDGHINAYDSFIEFYHHGDTVVIMELGIMYHWECADASYSAIRLEGIHQGYNRLYSAEFYRFNTSIHAVTLRDATRTDDFIDWLYIESLYLSRYPIVDYSGTGEYMGFHIWQNDLGLFDPHLEPYLPYGYRRGVLTLYLKTDREDGFEDTVWFLLRVMDLDTGLEYFGQFRQSARMRSEDFALFGNHTARVRIWDMKYLPNSARIELYSYGGGSEPFYWCQWGI
ncbi:MAG: hypothetical protein ACTSPB_18670 [Candidatus Thorarchaeota archaeon]